MALCSKRSPGQSLLSDPEGEQGFPLTSLIPFLFLCPQVPLLLSHISEDLNKNVDAPLSQFQTEHKGEEIKLAVLPNLE